MSCVVLGLRRYCACWTICAVALAIGAASHRVSADEAVAAGPPAPPAGVGSRELWVGADAGARNWLVYSGGTYAPWGDIHADGFRLRTTAGYGQYSYHFDAGSKVAADKTVADILAGYQMRFGELTAKAFLGYALLDLTFHTTTAAIRRSQYGSGIKGAVELWLNLGPSAWTSLDISYADVKSTASVRSRIGYRVLPTVSVGIEGALNHADLTGEVQTGLKTEVRGNVRGGAFVRYEWFGGEISASGGVAGDWTETRGSGGGSDLLHAPQAYGTLNWIVQF